MLGEKTVKPVACATESGVAINNEVSVNFPSQLLPAAPTPVVSAPTPLVSAPTPLLSAPTPNMPQATNPVEAEALHCLGHYLMLPVRTKTEKNRQKRTRYKMNKRMKKAAEGEKTVKPVACATESGVAINNEVSVNFPSQLLPAAPTPVVSAPTPLVSAPTPLLSAPTPNMPQATNPVEAEALHCLGHYLMLPFSRGAYFILVFLFEQGEKTVKPVACATESGVAINNEVSVNFPSQLLPAAPTPVVSAPTPLVSAPTPLLSAPTPNMPQATNPVEAEALHCLGHYLMLPVRTKTEKNRQKRTRYKMNKRMKKAAEGEKTSVKPVACATESGVTINNEVSVNFPSPLLAAAPIPVVSAPTPVVPAPTPNMPQATNLDEAEALRLLARYLMLPVRTKTEKNRQKRTRYKMNKRMKKAAEVACESDCQPHGVITVPGIFTSLEQQYDNPVPECMRNAHNPQYEMLPEERSEKLPDALDTKDETVKDIEKLLSTFQEKLFDLEKQLLLEQHQRQEMDFDKHDVDTEFIGLND
ncbi:uncharacterized protein LOC110832339 [Zootermopsis nevadensis]|nr:uncharacterized protein LOC110832339 [Zootermopsis nevadensis]